MIKFTLDPTNPPQLSSVEAERLNTLTDEQITAAAKSDPDNPPLTQAELRRLDELRLARRARGG